MRVAQDCAADTPGVRTVFASRHGELVRTTSMLGSLAANETVSPTSFGMSVLNASVGLFSVLQGNTAPATAISAGCASFGYGLIEACLQLAESPEQPVLFVFADEPAPAEYGNVDGDGDSPLAIGLLLDSSAACRMQCSWSVTSDVTASTELQAMAFLRGLESGESEWCACGRSWFWRREA